MSPIQLRDPDPIPPKAAPHAPPSSQRAGESKSQTIDRLAAELKVAKMAQTHAERRFLELQDIVQQKDQLMKVSSQQAEGAWEVNSELKRQLASQDVVIKRLKQDAEQYPLSNAALVKANQILSETIQVLRECFTCPLCYDGLAKAQAVSLRCGHTFCQCCVESWSESFLDQEARSSTSARTFSRCRPGGSSADGGDAEGALVQCPECRTTGTRRIRLYMLEEAIRLVCKNEEQINSIQRDEAQRRKNLEIISDVPGHPDYLSDS